MALIQHGSFEDLSVTATSEAAEVLESLTLFKSVGALREAARKVQPLTVEASLSPEARGIALRRLTLLRSFEGLIANLFNPTNEIFFLAWAWDLSGDEPYLYPGKGADPESCILQLKAGESREFTMGAGIALWPGRVVSGGISLRIQIWDSDAGVRRLGEVLETVSKSIKDSKLTQALRALSILGGPTTASLNMVKDASVELAGAIGTILRANSNDFVDYYEGYYPVSEEWEKGEETHKATGTELVLNRFV